MSRLQFPRHQSGELVWYPPEGLGGATAQLIVYTQGDALLPGGSWPQTVDRDPQSTTVAVETERDDDELPVVSSAGFSAEDRLLLIIPSGQRFELRLVGAANNTLFLDQPLPKTIPSGSVVSGWGYRFTLSPSHLSELRRGCRAQWMYTVAGKPCFHPVRFDVVNEPFILALTESDIERHDHTFGESAGSSGRWRSLIDGAHDAITGRIEAQGLFADLILDREALKDAICLMVLAKFYGSKAGADMRALSADWMKQAERAVADMIQARVTYDKNQNQVSEPGEQGTPVQYMKLG